MPFSFFRNFNFEKLVQICSLLFISVHCTCVDTHLFQISECCTLVPVSWYILWLKCKMFNYFVFYRSNQFNKNDMPFWWKVGQLLKQDEPYVYYTKTTVWAPQWFRSKKLPKIVSLTGPSVVLFTWFSFIFLCLVNYQTFDFFTVANLVWLNLVHCSFTVLCA